MKNKAEKNILNSNRYQQKNKETTMRKKKKQLPAPTVKLCPACKGTTFTEKNLPAQDGLPAVRGWMCAKCGRTYWHKNESLAYQQAKKGK